MQPLAASCQNPRFLGKACPTWRPSCASVLYFLWLAVFHISLLRLPNTPAVHLLINTNRTISTSWRRPQPGQNGKAHKKPLGAPHHPHCELLYVRSAPNHRPLTRPDQVAASLEGYFWPKIFWDFLTTNLDGAVKPIPILQAVNTVFGLSMFALELPLKPLAGTLVHQSIEFRLMLMPLLALAAIVMYQGTNAALYYIVGEMIYLWAYSDGEVPSSYVVLELC